MKWKNKCKVFGIRLLTACALFLGVGMQAEAGTLYDSGYVKFSPDGTAWTFAEELPEGYSAIEEETGPAASKEAGVYFDSSDNFFTNITHVRQTAGVGQHEYSYKRLGEVPVSEWKVSHEKSQCWHTLPRYPVEWHGLVADTTLEARHNGGFRTIRCSRRYYSGWNAICADCGGKVMDRNIYGSKDAVSSITSIDTRLAHYYLCPSCSHLEQAVEEPHQCVGVSYNKYAVQYKANTFDEYSGFTPMSFHMYDNATVYEGDEIVPQTTLNLNNYTRKGFAFKEWNTKPDGSGTSYADGAEIFNLTDENYDEDTGKGIVTLYAQWVTSESTLKIDAAGGTYKGVDEYTQTCGYGTIYEIEEERLVPPAGCVITYKTNEGNIDGKTDPQETITKAFDGWDDSELIHGRMKNGQYAFLGADGTTDKLTATYTSGSVVLPQPKRAGYAFGGWFLDDACQTQPVGMQGDVYTPPSSSTHVTLYAKWVGLILWSTPNLAVDGGKGGVNLEWRQEDGNNKIYRIYQSRSGAPGSYDQINVTSQRVEDAGIESTLIQYNPGAPVQIYEVKSDGYYTISAIGGSGNNYGTYRGGNGGKVTATFYLEEGDRLAISCGQQGGGGVGTAGEGANGGQETVVQSASKGVLMIVGGGGGALKYADGKCGGGLIENADAVAADRTGKNGYAGGGNGAVPGNAGTYTKAHTCSVEEGCYHVHKGDITNGGECYTLAEEGIHCGTYVCSDHWYGFADDGTGYCGRCRPLLVDRYSHPDNSHYEGTWTCGTCGDVYTTPGPSEIKTAPHMKPGYTLSCGMTESTLICTKPNTVDAITPARGGMNYVASSRIYVTSNTTDSSEADYENGRVWIDVTNVGATEICRLEGVSAHDEVAPGKITSYDTEGAGGNQVLVTWEKPVDEGTPYYHQAKSYALNTGDECESNVRRDVITTGVKGYYYIVNTVADTKVNTTNAQNKNDLLEQDRTSDICKIRVAMTEEVQYLHLVAMDVAGNLDEDNTIHIPIDKDVLPFPIMTDQISVTDEIGEAVVRDYGSVYRVGTSNSYYVRADGRTPFLLSNQSYMDGLPRANYMIDYQQYHVAVESSEQTFITRLPYSAFPNSERVDLSPAAFVRRVTGSNVLTDAMYTKAARGAGSIRVGFCQAFSVGSVYSGKSIIVTPVAGATSDNPDAEEPVTYSDWGNDSTHAVELLPDGVGPEISGAEMFEGCDSININDGFTALDINVTDALSGLRSCEVKITNKMNRITSTWNTDDTGHLYIDFLSGYPIFEGDFSITITAIDNVGNPTVEEYGTFELILVADIVKARDDGSTGFVRGETAILKTTTYGNADKLEVIFPPELLVGNGGIQTTFEYSEPEYEQKENISFVVPLYAEPKTYTVIVRAYKGGVMVQESPTMLVVNGSILDRVRVRIR